LSKFNIPLTKYCLSQLNLHCILFISFIIISALTCKNLKNSVGDFESCEHLEEDQLKDQARFYDAINQGGVKAKIRNLEKMLSDEDIIEKVKELVGEQLNFGVRDGMVIQGNTL